MQESPLALQAWGNFSIIASTLFFVLYVCFSKRKNESLHITSSIVVGFGLIMLLIEDPLTQITDIDLLRYSWYNSFALLDTCILAAIYITHRKQQLKLTTSSKMIVVNYGTLALLQYIAYWDQLSFQLAIVSDLYLLAIPAISLTISSLLILTISKEFILESIIHPEQEKNSND